MDEKRRRALRPLHGAINYPSHHDHHQPELQLGIVMTVLYFIAIHFIVYMSPPDPDLTYLVLSFLAFTMKHHHVSSLSPASNGAQKTHPE